MRSINSLTRKVTITTRVTATKTTITTQRDPAQETIKGIAITTTTISRIARVIIAEVRLKVMIGISSIVIERYRDTSN